jgi:D-alanine-D-alanine ligase
VRVARLASGLRETIQGWALTAFQALGLRDYARCDFRVAGDRAYLIEVNPNPYLDSNAEFIRAARASGRTYPRTILEIVEHALARYAARPAAR